MRHADHHCERRLADFRFNEMVFRLFGNHYLAEDVLETNVGLLLIDISGI